MTRNVLLYAEGAAPAAELVTAAGRIAEGGAIVVVVPDNHETASAIAGLGCAVVNLTGVTSADPAAVSAAVKKVAEDRGADVVLCTADRKGRLVGARLAAELGSAFLSNVDALDVADGAVLCTRNALGGMLVTRQKALTDRAVVAVSPKSHPEAAQAGGGSVEDVDAGAAASLRVTSVDVQAQQVSDIAKADTLVIVGQGVSHDDLDKVQALAERLGGLVACSKPVSTDKKWFGADHIVGISGKTCKPSLAVILGVSGQVQFYTGIRDAKVIAAVNTDENAPIAGLADYLLVDDCATVIPALEAAL